MKILTAEQTRELDRYTIAHEPIASLALMERAARAFTTWFIERFTDRDRPVWLYCGPGNNGGDGLAVARMLHEDGYEVRVIRCLIGDQLSDDNRYNLERLQSKRVVAIQTLQPNDALPSVPAGAIVVDALFGSGLSRPVTGYWAHLLDQLNEQPVVRVAIDVPSGLFADRHTEGTTLHADYTVCFQLPKLAFFLPENGEAVGEWVVVPIGLHPQALAAAATPYHYLQAADLRPLLYHRRRFDHKGTFGHALIVAGSYGKMGACILSSRAALRAGAGLVTVHVPRCGYEIIQIAFPEAMAIVDQHKFAFSQVGDLDRYDAVGVGPGLGTNDVTFCALRDLIEAADQPLVLDADALNIISHHPELLSELPPHSILTPHPKEFERLFGATDNDFTRLEVLRERARTHQLVIVLKSGATAIAAPDGTIYFNSTGNPGMGTAGTGDVLTGMLTGLLAQGYSPLEAAQIGVFLHGLAGDLAAADLEQECLIAEDLISHLGKAMRALKQEA